MRSRLENETQIFETLLKEKSKELDSFREMSEMLREKNNALSMKESQQEEAQLKDQLEKQKDVSSAVREENAYHLNVIRELNREMLNVNSVEHEMLQLRELNEHLTQEQDSLRHKNKQLQKQYTISSSQHESLRRENTYHLNMVNELNTEILNAKSNHVKNMTRELKSHEHSSDIRDRELKLRLQDTEARCQEWRVRSEQNERALQRAQMLRDIRESETSTYHEQSVALWAETKKRTQEVQDLTRTRDEQATELRAFRSKLMKHEDEIAKYALEKKRSEEGFFGGLFN